MIIWGIRKKIISGSSTEKIQCPDCRNRDFIKYGILRYFHIFWIPLFVFSKSPGLECSQCRKIIKGRDLDKEMRKDIKSDVFSLKHVLKGNFGLILVMSILLLFSAYVTMQM